MVPEGPILTGALRTGGTLAHSFTLSPGKCYAAYGVGLGIGRDLFGGVRELDLSIAMLSPAGSTVLARDATAGPVASLGTRGNCVKWPYPIAAQGRFVVRVAAGDGVAAAQLYVK